MWRSQLLAPLAPTDVAERRPIWVFRPGLPSSRGEPSPRVHRPVVGVLWVFRHVIN